MRVIKPFRKLFKNWDKEAIKGQAFIDAYQADTREVLNVVSRSTTFCAQDNLTGILSC